MKVLVISDTHGKIKNIDKELKKHAPLDYIIHLGDYSTDAQKLIAISDVPVEYVLGNCDMGQMGSHEKVITIGGKRMLLTHGHRENVKMTLDKLYYKAKEAECSIAFYGHTHVRYIEEDDVLLVNPGSYTLGKGGTPNGYCILEIMQEEVNVKFCDV